MKGVKQYRTCMVMFDIRLCSTRVPSFSFCTFEEIFICKFPVQNSLSRYSTVKSENHLTATAVHYNVQLLLCLKVLVLFQCVVFTFLFFVRLSVNCSVNGSGLTDSLLTETAHIYCSTHLSEWLKNSFFESYQPEYVSKKWHSISVDRLGRLYCITWA